jgi:hypothetical protein
MMDNTLHDLIAQLGELRAEKKRLDYAARKVTEHITAKEREIIDVMDDQHITETKSEAGKVTLGEAVYPKSKTGTLCMTSSSKTVFFTVWKNALRFLRTAKS